MPEVVKHYTLTIDLNALYHLGINLYSNLPAVISEAVANSWDADAGRVTIDVDKTNRTVTIQDDGRGMDEKEINEKYLKVGYRKRVHEGAFTPWLNRHVMGRKGIGKLSLFSIANTIEVHSVRTEKDGTVIDRNALRMVAGDIRNRIESGDRDYEPTPLDPALADFSKGTRIKISDLKSDGTFQVEWVRKRLARRFAVIGADHSFEVVVDSEPITIDDRDFFGKLQYLWAFGDDADKFTAAAKNAKQTKTISGVVNETLGYVASGWIGTFKEQSNMTGDENNSIVVLAWGKLIHENLLPEVDEAGLFKEYLIGEVRADFIDADDQEDLATSDRQRLRVDDPRYRDLVEFVQSVVKKHVKLDWAKWRAEGATETALKNPIVQEWYEALTPDNKKYARDVFERIERAHVPSEELRKELYKQGILAFESYAHRENLSALAAVSGAEEFRQLVGVIGSMDQLEEAHYYSITKNRVEVLTKLEQITPMSKEKTIQTHIFNHLWLLDPSWERASTDEKMEVTIEKAWEKVDKSLPKKEREARLDIKYKTAAGKHIIIELKKYDVKVEAVKLAAQIQKYVNAARRVLQKAYPGQPLLIEAICILGSAPLPADQPEQAEKLLAAVDARFITYDQLIRWSRESYRDYLNASKKISRIRDIIEKL